tara:strand:+ start:1272 stop:1649 length:378 start_codon:yes stop_codon:yes gene_type:complete
MRMNKQYVNIPNTREWVKLNDDTHAKRYRELFVEHHGGEFVHNGRFWQWMENIEKDIKDSINEEKNDVATQKQLYIITKPDGGQVTIDNLSKFCRENKLNKSAMYLVMNGKRNHHKHHKCSKIEE